MTDNPLYNTASMARLCADQGYFDRSAEIYRRLLKTDPENEAWRRELAEVEAKQSAVTRVSGMAAERLDQLEPLIQKWVQLMVEHNLKVEFDKIRNIMRNRKTP